MRSLFEFDLENYDANGTVGRRPSVRGIIIKGDKIALIHSLRYDYYKFPGGGNDEHETHEEALVREVLEEAGLVVIPESIKEYGLVLRMEKGKHEDLFIQENYYYFCKTKDEVSSQQLDDYEEEELFTLGWVKPEVAINTNYFHNHLTKNSEFAQHMMEREARVLAMLISEGYFTENIDDSRN